MTDPVRARTLRRRHMHERQAVVFGVLLAGLAVAGLGAAAVFTGAVDLPFARRDFAVAATPTSTADPVPCPPDGALPVPADQITANVYNAAGRSGLARQTADELATRGFVIAVVDNATVHADATRVAFGVSGVAQAYTVAAHIPGAVLSLDARADATVDVLLGSSFEALTDPAATGLDPAGPLVAPAGCVPLAELTAPAAAPAATTPAA